jgi:Kef-type K+ transport system membrane component KefB
MIPRGEVGLVFAGVGSASGALSEATEAAIIMMVILTTFIAPPLLRLVFQQTETTIQANITPSAEGASNTSETMDKLQE